MSDLSNPLLGNTLTYDLGDLDMNDLFEQSAQRGGSTDAVWDDETQSYYRSTTEVHNRMDLALRGLTVEDITSVDYSEPVYFVGGGSIELGEVQQKYVINEDGTQALKKQFMTESELREQWDADEGMGAFKKANPHLTFDKYMDMIKDGTLRWREGGESIDMDSFYSSLAEDHGVQTVWQNSDGDVFNFSGSGYVKSYKVDDHMSPGDWMKTAMTAAVTAGAAAALAPTLAGAIGVNQATAKALINSAISLAQNGEVSLADAFALAGANIPGLGALDEVTDVSQDVIDDAINAVVGEILNQDNYGKNDDNQPVFTPTVADITGETTQGDDDEFVDDFGVDVDITMPEFPQTDDSADAGGGGDEGGAEAGDPAEPTEPSDPAEPVDPVGEDDVQDKRWVYRDGVWTDGYEVIYGPGNEGDQMSDEEMSGAWESGDYSWEAPDEAGVGEPDEIGFELPDFSFPTISEPTVQPPADPSLPDASDDPSEPSSDDSGDGQGGDMGGDGSGAGGDSGTGEGSGAGDAGPGTGGGTGGGTGTGEGPGEGPGEGSGDGGRGDSDAGMMSGGKHDPEWGELFQYTTLTPYQKKQLEPIVPLIGQARGLMNGDIA